MLDSWIIEEIKKKEQEAEENRPYLELPVSGQNQEPLPTEEERGIIIIQIGDESEEEE
jgi:hypothetical protein